MNIDSGTAIVLVYVLVSMGVITASLLAALATGRFIDRLRERRSRQTVPGGERREGSDRSGAAKLNESLLVCRSSPGRGIPEPIHVRQVCRATSVRSATLERQKFFLRTRSVAWDLRHITSPELATIQSNGQMFDFARTTTNIAQTPTGPAAFLTVTYRSICDSFFAGTITCGT